MKNIHIRKILAVTLICSMISGNVVFAAEESQTPVNSETSFVEESKDSDLDSEIIDEADETIDAEADVNVDAEADEEADAGADIEDTAEVEEENVEEAEDDFIEENEEEMNVTVEDVPQDIPQDVPQDFPEKSTETTDIVEEETEDDIDEATQNLVDEYRQIILSMQRQRAAVGTYESELAKFPEDYQKKLKALHKQHSNWIFVAVETGLDWKEVVEEESSKDRNLIEKQYSRLLLSKASGDYNLSTGSYIPKDGSTWVTTSKNANAYYLDSRNFLNENYIFMFEALDYSKNYHTLQGVKNILKNTDLSDKKISYINTKGVTKKLDITYEEAIYAAGVKYKVSPLFLASKIKQETGAKLSNGSISGKFEYNGVSYRGYYNYYNIGATATSTGSAVANGLSYAKKSGSYSRPWNSPVLAIEGGAEFLAEKYIAKGQNTSYFQKFNTVVEPYYGHQYMQSLTAAASEGRLNYSSYVKEGIHNNAYVFYIPVYENMPAQNSEIKISKSVTKGKATTTVNMRSGPSVSTGIVTQIPANATVKVSGGTFTDESLPIYNQITNPYWFKITYDSYEGYVSSQYLKMNTNSTIKIGGTKTLKVSGVDENEQIYYDSSDPTIASVSADGKVKGLKEGNCTIYAISGSAKSIDSIGIKVSESKISLDKPSLTGASYDNSSASVTVKWQKVNDAEGYYVYRKLKGDSTWEEIGTVKGGETLQYKDSDLEKGKTYVYTVKAYNGNVVSSYNSTGITITIPTKTYTTYETITDSINYRTGPGTSYAKKGMLNAWVKIEVEDGYSKKANGYTWKRFKLNGKNYYVASKYIQKYVALKKPVLVSAKYSNTKDRVTVKWKKVNGAAGYYVYRKVKGGNWKKLGTVKTGTKVTYNNTSISHNVTYYYTVRAYRGDFTSSRNSTGIKVTIPKKVTYTKYKTTSNVNYRKGAGTSYAKAGKIIKGKVVYVEDGYSKTANGYKWVRIKINDTKYYVALKYLKKA